MLGSCHRRLEREATVLGLLAPLLREGSAVPAIASGGVVQWSWLVGKNLEVGWVIVFMRMK